MTQNNSLKKIFKKNKSRHLVSSLGVLSHLKFFLIKTKQNSFYTTPGLRKIKKKSSGVTVEKKGKQKFDQNTLST